MPNISFGAHPSKKDKRDIKDKHLALATAYPDKYSVDMSKIGVFYQSKLGICTAAALVCSIIEYLYWKKTGKFVQLSVAFLYIVTKTKIDQNIIEGSSLRSALKAAYKYGVCTEATFPTDVEMSHGEFISQKIPDAAWTEALNYTIGGYVSIPVDQSLIAAAMYKYGPLYARFEVSSTWFTPSWMEKDISPLKAGKPVLSGHATAIWSYDLSTDDEGMWLRNTWGSTWFRNGDGYFNFRDYKPTEVWAVTLDSVQHLSDTPAVLDSIGKKILDILRKIGVIS